MELILEEDIIYKTKINDFGVEPINKRIITTGEKLIYFNKNKFEKESGHIRNQRGDYSFRACFLFRLQTEKCISVTEIKRK